jgi:phospholipid/cholesterol/gamma-HCH transport system permease protein
MHFPLSTVSSVGEFAHFAVRALASALHSLLHPAGAIRQIHSVFIGALPLGIVTGIALGAVVWMHTHSVLARYGSTEFLPTALAAAVLLELAPLGAGLIVAARTGSSLGAELGAMKINEQIDALEMLGVSAQRMLVGPRVLACIISLPILHVFISSLALLSGYVAEQMSGGMNAMLYQSACLRELYARDVIAAGLKTLVFGFLIGVAGCYQGMKADGGAEGVGRAATSAVVTASLLVIASDVLLVALIRVVLG